MTIRASPGKEREVKKMTVKELRDELWDVPNEATVKISTASAREYPPRLEVIATYRGKPVGADHSEFIIVAEDDRTNTERFVQGIFGKKEDKAA